MLFDFLRRRGSFEIEELKEVVKRLDADMGAVFSAINDLKATNEKTVATVTDLKGRILKISKLGAIVIRNHDRLKGLEGRLEALNTHIYVRATEAPTPQQAQVSAQAALPSSRLFTEHSVNSVNDSVKPLNIQPPQVVRAAFDILTDMEKKTFVTLSALIGESEFKEVDFAGLVRELYPSLPLEKRRSTVSNFLRRLEDIGLIKRKRRGRRSSVFLTTVGLSAINEENFKRLRKTLLKEEQ